MISPNVDPVRLQAALEKAAAELWLGCNSRGFWEGELSSSALSTATAVTAFAVALKQGARFPATRDPQSSILSGLNWLAAHQNADGGWGDTTRSLSNISTTTLCWAAFGAAGADDEFASPVKKAEQWLAQRIGITDSEFRAPHSALARAIIDRYGKDRTFSVPILTLCALSGRMGDGAEAWRHVIPLPFELAAFPHQLFAALRLPVVSYALPALIAIGQARHVHAPSGNPLARMIRSATRKQTLQKLTEIQPGNGGFLEATPLTSFVTMSLAASGQQDHPVTQRGLEFLLKSQRTDGSWPIDTNLSTWCTTLALEALPHSACPPHSALDWLLQQQYTREHPYTHAAPGGWAWTDLPGGVPDADDTAGALLALHKMRRVEGGVRKEEISRAVEGGLRWLLYLQNRDGGIPTFCRGWGALPFDQSSADITAHAIRAWGVWKEQVSPELARRIAEATQRAIAFLGRVQGKDGSYAPLWFGNQFATDESNRTYGTSRVLEGLSAVCAEGELGERARALGRGCVHWLGQAQNNDGGWGGDRGIESSVEETALAVEALATAPAARIPRNNEGLDRGVNWLLERVESGSWLEPSPIGFYFAKLWYFERLYPVIFTVGALSAAAKGLDADRETGSVKISTTNSA